MDPDTEVADSNVVEALCAFAAGSAPAEPAAASGWAAELARAGAEGAPGDDPAPISREDVGLNFDDETVVARLEDRGLIERIRQAHASVAGSEGARAWPDAGAAAGAPPPPRPDLHAVRRADAEARRAMSQLVTALGECARDLRSAADDIFLHASNARKLSQNQLPHGYDVGPVSSYFVKLGDQTGKTGEGLEKCNAVLSDLLRDAMLARRGYENVIADLFAHCDKETGQH